MLILLASAGLVVKGTLGVGLSWLGVIEGPPLLSPGKVMLPPLSPPPPPPVFVGETETGVFFVTVTVTAVAANVDAMTEAENEA